jgi:DnaJ domain
MPALDYYEIFGVSPSATADEIRAAHRDLVKRYHPDIYSTEEDKARATEKLRAINEAYAVLSHPERRKKYDASRVTPPPPRPAPPRQPRAARRYPAAEEPRRRTARPRVDVRATVRRTQKSFNIRRIASAAVVLIVCGVAGYSVTRPPGITAGWSLLRSTEIEPPGSAGFGQARGWEEVGSFPVRAACAEDLKTRVRLDQQEGSQAVVDDVNGTMAITVLLTKVGTQPQAKNGVPGELRIIKRVRHYECRSVQLREPESWLRQKLRAIGLIA